VKKEDGGENENRMKENVRNVLFFVSILKE